MTRTYVYVIVYVPLPSLTLMLQQVIVMRSLVLESTRVRRDLFHMHKAIVSTYINRIWNIIAQTRRCHRIIVAASILHNFIIQEDGANDFQRISKFAMKTKAKRMEMETAMDYFFRQQIINNFLIFYTQHFRYTYSVHNSFIMQQVTSVGIKSHLEPNRDSKKDDSSSLENSSSVSHS